MSWLRNIFARTTAPEVTPGGPQSIWLPAKRGGIVITHENALQLSACFACVRVISADIAKLPWHVFAEQNGNRVKLARSQVGYLLNTRPNPDMGAFAWRETMISWALTYGNAYAEIERDMAGRPTALWQISPDRVQKKRGTDRRMYYEVSNGTQDPTIIAPENMFDLHGLGFDGLVGYSTIALAAQSIGFGMAAEQHGAAFYGNNAVLGMVLEHPMALSDAAYQRLKDSLEQRKGAGAFQPFIAEEGMKVNIPTTKQVDAQYVETRQAQVEEICRWFRVPPQKVMNLKDAHYNNVEQMNIAYVTDTLGEWIKRLEEEADYKLISVRSQASYTKINTRAIMRGDSAAQAQWYREMRNIGVYSVDEIRELEDMDPVPGGEKRVTQVNMTTLEKIGEEPEPAAQPPGAREVADTALEAAVRKLVNWDADALAKTRAPITDFEKWSDHYQVLNGGRLRRELAALCPVLSVAYRTDADAEVLAMLYEDGRRLLIERMLSGEQVDMVREITDSLRNAL